MRIITLIAITLYSMSLFAQDPISYLNEFDKKVYSLKTKGVQDFIVDVESNKLTQQINEQGIFGRVNKLTFRVYWTANPERLAIDVLGLPEGFREVKEEMKYGVLQQLELLLPQTIVKKFTGYKFTPNPGTKDLIAKDVSGIASIPVFILKFDNQDKLQEIVGKKPVGTMNTAVSYEKESFADGKYVLKNQTTTVNENGQTITVKKELKYGNSNGTGVLSSVTTTTQTQIENSKAKPFILSETLSFDNYKINTGGAMKWFLGSEGK